MTAQSGIGLYKATSPVGTAFSKVHPAFDKPATQAGRANPGDFGMVAVGLAMPATNNMLHRTTILNSTTDGVNGYQRIPLGQSRDMVSLSFLISLGGSDPDGSTTPVQLWLEKELCGQGGVELVYEYLGTVQITAGTGAPLATGTILDPNARFCDTIAITEDASLSPGLRVTGQPATPANGRSVLNFDSKGAIAVIGCAADGTLSGNSGLWTALVEQV